MEQFIYDENNGLWYEQHGNYYLPCLTTSEEEPYIGVWGLRHLRYLKEYHKAIYNAFLLNGKLGSYLTEIDRQATDMFDWLVETMAKSQGLTEQLKADEPLIWTGKMNEIQSAAAETVYHDIIYVPALK